MEVVVDTNILVATIFEDDRNHKEAVKIWNELGKAFVPTIVFFEFAFFLVKYKVDLSLISKIVTDPKVQIVENNLDDLLYLSRHSRLVKHYDDIGDLLILSVASRLGIDMKTFDNELERLFRSE